MMSAVKGLTGMLLFVLLMLPDWVQGEITRFDVPVGNSPAIGPADAPLTMIEFLDYQ